MRPAVAALLAAACAAQSPKPTNADSARSPAGVLERAQQLPGLTEHRHYASPPDALLKYAKMLWPELRREMASPLVVDGNNGVRSLREWDGCTDDGQQFINEGEVYFQRGDMPAAAERYRKAIERAPRCYTALLYLGDCSWKVGDARAAVEIYDRGLALNHDDFRLHFFRADALMALGRHADALAGYVRALVLRPRRPSVMGNLRRAAGRLGVVVRDEPFLPRATVSFDGTRVDVDYDDGPWRYYGLCKALWRHEARAQWSSAEEHECLTVLLDAYHEAGGAPEPALDRLAAIARDGLLDAFIAYEIGSRVFPDLTLLLTDPQRDQVRVYVERWVVPSADRVGR